MAFVKSHKLLDPLKQYGLVGCNMTIKKHKRGSLITLSEVIYEKPLENDIEAGYLRLFRNYVKSGDFGFGTGFIVEVEWMPCETIETRHETPFGVRTTTKVTVDRLEIYIRREVLPPKVKCTLTKGGKATKYDPRKFR